MKKGMIFLLLVMVAFHAAAQSDSKPFGIKFKGFVKTDVMLDSRQTVAAREGHFLLWPANELMDTDGEDINAGANLNMLSVQTRLTGVITGPEAFGAKTSGLVEGAFFGHSNGDINGFRLRHAFVKLDWKTSTLLVGQYWHPMFITECFPGVVSFNTGVPFQPFSRNPQIRFIKKMNKMELTLVAASQRDFPSTGPAGGTSTYLRNAALPILNMNLKYKTKTTVVGAGVNYMTLKPSQVTLYNYKSTEKVSGISAIAFAKFTADKMTLKFEGVYGQNTNDLLMLGGYAVKTRDTTTGQEEYVPFNTLSAWGEIICGKKVQYGLFAGYTQNLGVGEEYYGMAYTRGADIASVFRVSPRIQVRKGNTQFAGEVEYTAAAYGTPDMEGVVKDTQTVSNLRFLFSAYLFF